MGSDDFRMYLFAAPGELFGQQAYGSDPVSAIVACYADDMCSGEIQPAGPWSVTMMEVPTEAEDELRDRLEEAACEEYVTRSANCGPDTLKLGDMWSRSSRLPAGAIDTGRSEGLLWLLRHGAWSEMPVSSHSLAAASP